MLTVVSGTPGAGKTLWTLVHVEEMRIKENRDVYYHNIKELTLPWKVLADPKKWFDLPSNAIIVIDEAQDVFPKRSNGSKVPEHVERMAKHRHEGFDVFLITQHPGKLDSDIRKDVEEHRHLMRKFGTHWSTVHLWKGIRENCEKSRSDSLSTQWRFPKKSFEWYKSAEVHTHKVNIPWKLVIPLIVAPVLVSYASYRVFWARAAEANEPPKTVSKAASGPLGAFPASPGFGGRAKEKKEPTTAAEYASGQIPRIPGLLHTAPVYDTLTQATKVPVPAACIESKKQGCKCFTQDATPYEMSPDMCVQIVRNGIFLPFEHGKPEMRPQARPPVASAAAPGGPALLITLPSSAPDAGTGTVEQLIAAHRGSR